MTHQELLTDRVDLVDELANERYIWMGERMLSGFATTERLDILLTELHDLDRALEQGEVSDDGPVPHQGYEPEEYDGA